MAETINVGTLRANLTADTAQFSGGFREADRSLKAFESSSKKYADSIIRSMSEAGKAATASSKMLEAMGAAGREAAAKTSAMMAEQTSKAAAWSAMLQRSATASAAAEKSFNQTAQAGGRAGAALTAVAGLIGSIQIGRMAAEAAEATSKIATAAERMQIGTEAVQRLGFAAEQSGSSLDAVGRAIASMAENLGKADAAKNLESIGLSFEKIEGLSPDQTFVTIAEAIRKIPDPLKQADLATNLLGKSAVELLPAIRNGFVEVGKAAPVMSDAVIKSGQRVGDSMQEIELRVSNLKAEALLPLMDFFTSSLPKSVQVGIAGLSSFIPSLEQVTLSVLALGGPSGAWAAVVAGSKAVVGSFGAITLAARGLVVTLWPVAAAIAAIWAAWKLGNTETVKNTVAEWALSSDNLTAKLFRAVAGIEQMTGAQARSAVTATAAAEAARATAEATGAIDKAIAAVIPPVADFNTKLETAKTQLAALTVEQRQNIAAGLELGMSVAEVAKELGIAESVVKLYKDSVSAAEKASAAAAAATKKHAAEVEALHQTWKRTVAANTKIMEEEAEAAAKYLKKESEALEAKNTLTLRSYAAITEATKELTRTSRENALERAEFEIEMAKRQGASWQTVYAMERRLADERLRLAIEDAEREFEIRTSWMDKTTIAGAAAYDALKQAHDENVRGMVEEHQRAELIKRDELERTHDVWRRTIDSAKALVQTLTDSMSTSFAAMLTGAVGFKEGFVNIWRSIQSHLTQILSDLLDYFISTFLKGMIGAMLGQSGAFSSAFSGLLGGGGGGGAAGGLLQAAAMKGGAAALSFVGIGGANAATAGVLAGNAAIAGATSGGAAAAGGAAAGAGGGLMGSMTAFLTNPWTAIGAGAILGGIALWKSGAFRGGEEALHVNPARDAFFQEFQNVHGGDQFSALATAFAEAGVSGDIAERLIRDLYNADEMDEFRAATEAIRETLDGTREAAEAASATVDAMGAAMAEFENTVASVEASGMVSEEAITSLRAAIAELATSGVSAETVAVLNSTLERMIEEGTASDEAIGALVDQVESFTATAGDNEAQVVDTAYATDGMTEAQYSLENALADARAQAADFASQLAELRSQLAQPIELPPIIVPEYVYPTAGGETAPVIESAANEAIFRTPTLAMVGDANEPEWVLHQSSVAGLLQRGALFGAGLADAAGSSSAAAGSSSGAGDIYVTASINVSARPGMDGRSLAEQLVTALPTALRRDDGLRRKIRGAVR